MFINDDDDDDDDDNKIIAIAITTLIAHSMPNEIICMLWETNEF